MQGEMERTALQKEKDAASQERVLKLDKLLADLKEQSARLTAQFQAEKAQIDDAQKIQRDIDAARTDLETGPAARGTHPRQRDPVRSPPGTPARSGRPQRQARRGAARRFAHVAGGSHAQRHRGGRQQLDAHPGHADERGRTRKARQDGGSARQARHRPARGHRGGVQRRAPFAQRLAGPEPAHRLVHVPRADRRREKPN